MNKKTLLTLIFSLLIMLFAGCGQSEQPETGGQAGEAEEAQTGETNTDEEQKEEQANVEPKNYPQFEEVNENERVVIIHTTKGNIKAKLFPEQAPKTVENFITHSQNGYYDGIIFHRVIKDFMIQTGDPQGNGTGGESIFGGPFEDEFTPELANFRGALSMANSGPNTNGSQFFIVQKQSVEDDMIEQMKEAGFPEKTITYYKEKGGTPWLDFRHTVFGQVIEGMDVVDAIANAETVANDKPAEEIKIQKIEVIQ